MHCVGADEIRSDERLLHRFNVFREPDVVVAEIADDLPASLRKRFVPVELTLPRALGMVEEAHALVYP